jgi:hypothetical protein
MAIAAHVRRGIRRLGWFVGLWTASVLCVAALGFLIRFWLGIGSD